ncbi:5-formyltetrahydrofolate cyclo-ligase [Sphingomonas sp. Leaf17]|nr:5-formyltetrahydrofolate cyclo-ligase [Sphingomonas sp. Leaf17]
MVPSPSPSDDKRDRRARLRAARAGFAHAGFALDGALPVPDAFRRRLAPGLTVASYVPLGDEADPAPFADAARDAGCRIALPHVAGRGAAKEVDRMRFLYPCGRDLENGPYGLLQPPADAAEAVPDIVLTPLLGFDRRGTRLGQGAGYYDRAFALLPNAWRVGIAWSVQEVETLVADPWDMPLHAIATELEWIES